MAAYRVELGSVSEEHGGTVGIDDSIDLGTLVVGDESFELVEPASFSVTVTNTGAGFVLAGTIAARVRAECSRCLCAFETVITAQPEGFYIRRGDEHTIPDDQEFGYVGDRSIDIAPALIAALALEAPFAPVHDEDCAGLCAECGADLNLGECDCATARAAEGPFAALGELLPTDESEPAE